MLVFVSLIPLYVFIPEIVAGRELFVPDVPLDHLVPLRPTWVLVYSALYLFLILLPVLAVRDETHINRTVLAYLTVWIVAYACFLTVPTIAPRPPEVVGAGFGAWSLRLLYGADPPYNCFPSLHVAHSFVSALTCYRIHRGVGAAAVIAASFVGISTLYTKQHYVLDVAAGVLLATVAYVVFLHGLAREGIPELDRRLTPVLALGLLGGLAILVASSWLVYIGG